ncbi:MAG TPA: VWA domain-containing protein [Bryobacteraceae bacterium]|nr:VWA domain-containing protein [Bryobacteraceae bacterium]
MQGLKVGIAVLTAGLFASLAIAVAQEGPTSDSSETVAKPHKKDTENPSAKPSDNTQLPKIPSKFEKKNNEPAEGTPTFRSDVFTVSVDVSVLDNKGHFIPNIPKGNFRVLEDSAPQKIETFAAGEAPMTVCLLIEFSNLFQQYWTEGWYQTLTAAYGFAQTLKPDDYVAVIAYDMRPEILSDFTTDRRKTYEALSRLRIAGFSESNLFDALVDTEERMENIDGRKAIVLLASGRDTFSKLTFDKARKRIQEAGVPIYAVGLLQALREMADAYGAMGPISRMDFLQADNEMKTFAKETGGQSYFPRFYGEFPSIYHSISDSLRNEYTLTYHPVNQARDGSYRKIKVELVNPATNEPLRVVDEKGKPIKYQILAKAGYKAPRQVE